MRPSDAAIDAAVAMERKEYPCPGWKTGASCGTIIVYTGRMGRPPQRCDFCRVKRVIAQQRRKYRRYAEKKRAETAAAAKNSRYRYRTNKQRR